MSDDERERARTVIDDAVCGVLEAGMTEQEIRAQVDEILGAVE